MASIEGDFEKGENNGSKHALELPYARSFEYLKKRLFTIPR